MHTRAEFVMGLGSPDAKQAACNRMILAIVQARGGSKTVSWLYYIPSRNSPTKAVEIV